MQFCNPKWKYDPGSIFLISIFLTVHSKVLASEGRSAEYSFLMIPSKSFIAACDMLWCKAHSTKLDLKHVVFEGIVAQTFELKVGTDWELSISSTWFSSSPSLSLSLPELQESPEESDNKTSKWCSVIEEQG